MFPFQWMIILIHIDMSITTGWDLISLGYNVRLSFGWYGVVELTYNNVTGTVCDNHWSWDDCNVVCRELGYGCVGSEKYGIFGVGSGPIWLDNVQCNGDEHHLYECSHGGWGQHNCVHNEDAACICEYLSVDDIPSVSQEEDISLYTDSDNTDCHFIQISTMDDQMTTTCTIVDNVPNTYIPMTRSECLHTACKSYKDEVNALNYYRRDNLVYTCSMRMCANPVSENLHLKYTYRKTREVWIRALDMPTTSMNTYASSKNTIQTLTEIFPSYIPTTDSFPSNSPNLPSNNQTLPPYGQTTGSLPSNSPNLPSNNQILPSYGQTTGSLPSNSANLPSNNQILPSYGQTTGNLPSNSPNLPSNNQTLPSYGQTTGSLPSNSPNLPSNNQTLPSYGQPTGNLSSNSPNLPTNNQTLSSYGQTTASGSLSSNSERLISHGKRTGRLPSFARTATTVQQTTLLMGQWTSVTSYRSPISLLISTLIDHITVQTSPQDVFITTEDPAYNGDQLPMYGNCSHFPTWLGVIPVYWDGNGTMTYSCQRGYMSSTVQDNTAKCLTSGEWDPPLLSCFPQSAKDNDTAYSEPVEAPYAEAVGSVACIFLSIESVLILAMDLGPVLKYIKIWKLILYKSV